MKRILFFAVLLAGQLGFGQCPFASSTQSGSTQSICYNNNVTGTNIGRFIYTAVPVDRYIAVNVVSGIQYRIATTTTDRGFVKRLTLFNGSNTTTALATTNATATNTAATIDWTATFTGVLYVVFNTTNCQTSTQTDDITASYIGGGNNVDSQTASGTNSWIGHVYNFLDSVPIGGGGSPGPSDSDAFSSYIGYFTQNNTVSGSTISFNNGYGGDDTCLNVTAGGIIQSVRTETFSVRYRMQTTSAVYPAGCYFVNIAGDDGVRLYIDGTLVFNSWIQQGTTNYNNVLVYLNGNSQLLFDFYEKNGGNVSNFSIFPAATTINGLNTVTPAGSTIRCASTTTLLTGGTVATQGNNTIAPVQYQWQSSTDNTTWTNISGATTKDYTVPGTSPTVATQIYYRRNVQGSTANSAACVYSSNVVSIITSPNTAPAAPTSAAGTNISCSSFTANWSASTTATSYRLDVSTVNTFTSFVAGYQDLNVGFVTSYNVTGLGIGAYYYRVRAVNSCGSTTSSSSTVQTVTTINPSATISGTTTVCQNTTSPNVTFTNPRTSAITVTYRINGGADQTINIGASTTAIVAAPTTASGTFVYSLVSVVYQTAPTCSTTISGSATVTVSSPPTVAIAGADQTGTATCGLTSVTLAGNTPTVGTGTWTIISGTGGIITTPSSATSTFSGTAGSTYTLRWTIVNSPCTSSTDDVVITFNISPSSPTIGTITNVTCSSATGSVVLSGLQNGWIITQSGFASGSYTSSGTSYTVTGLAVGNYNFTVNNGTCTSASTPNVPIADASSATWNGSGWVGSIAPDATKNIIIASSLGSPFAANLSGCSLTINTGVTATVPSGVTLTITNAVTTNGQLIFQNNASLVQTTNATNVGAIEYRRLSTQMKNFDFTYWSSPVWGDGIVVPKQTAKNLSPNTLADKYFRFSGPANDWVFDDGEMIPGAGYIIRVPKPGSPAPDNWSGSTYSQPVAFKGVPNNGNYSFVVGTDQYNLVGNPYPSAIRADDFINANSGIIYGALYFWTHNTAIQQSGSNYIYTADDYATYNITGGTAGGPLPVPVSGPATNPGLNTSTPNGFIAAGQSFFVGNGAAGSFQFTNAMRVSGNNSQFFKQASTKKTATIEKNRVWLNLTNSGGAFKQLLVGYITGATNDWDNLYDGPSFDGQEFVDFYSINQGQNLSIQGRALPFENTDVVPLGYRSTIAGSFNISIDNRDGALASQEIWLEDKKTNTLHELTKGNYAFTTIKGVENDRFLLKYTNTNKTLETDESVLADQAVIVSIKNKKITLTSSAEAIVQVQVYDLLGRKIYEKSKIIAQELTISTLSSSEQTLILKTTLANGVISSKKIMY